jgi:Domain of unknown function (DUF4185)
MGRIDLKKKEMGEVPMRPKLTRRYFVLQSCGTALSVAALRSNARPRIQRIMRLVLRDDTILRLGGIGDCFVLTWGADGKQYVLLNDGAGWDKNPTRMYNHRMFSISGGPQNAKFSDLESYPYLPHAGLPKTPRYYGWGTLAINSKIYQFLSTASSDLTGFTNVKLIYSPDSGHTWCNRDGTTPVTWNRLDDINRHTMLFLDEPEHSFSQLSCLQMGQAYRANRDGYAYIYSPNGITEGTMNQLVVCRVPKTQILDRAAYQFFSGTTTLGMPVWSKKIEDRSPVCTFPHGWVGEIPLSWIPSVVYNEPLGVYMMVNFGWKYDKPPQYPPKVPSYLGFWTAPNPWGPWTQIYEDTAWRPGGDPNARAYMPQIAPAWISADGKSFWLVWSDYQGAGSFSDAEWQSLRELKGEFAANLAFHRAMKYYAFNTQRVDIEI